MMRKEDLPDVTKPVNYVQDTTYQIAQYLEVPVNQVKIIRVELCAGSEDCENLNQASGTLKSYDIVRVYVDIPGRVALGFQDDLYNSDPKLFNECEAFSDKIVRTYQVEQCNTEIFPTFDESRNSLTVDEVLYVESNSFAWSFSILLLTVSALF